MIFSDSPLSVNAISKVPFENYLAPFCNFGLPTHPAIHPSIIHPSQAQYSVYPSVRRSVPFLIAKWYIQHAMPFLPISSVPFFPQAFLANPNPNEQKVCISRPPMLARYAEIQKSQGKKRYMSVYILHFRPPTPPPPPPPPPPAYSSARLDVHSSLSVIPPPP
ncbi:hypothetical protein VTK26DRAFT_6317 [Humicola hyalothermophila]